MERIVIKSQIGAILAKATGYVVLCDAEGRALGMFQPMKDHPPVDKLKFEPPRSVAESEELRKKHRTGKPLEEILKRLGY
jgi:hypothetical protein